MAKRLLILAAIIGVGFYIYKEYWMDKIQVEFVIGSDNISVESLDRNYRDCKIKTSGEYEGKIDTLRAGQRHFLSIYDLKQWNGTQLQSIGVLDREVTISISCAEGRYSTKVSNAYSNQKISI